MDRIEKTGMDVGVEEASDGQNGREYRNDGREGQRQRRRVEMDDPVSIVSLDCLVQSTL